MEENCRNVKYGFIRQDTGFLMGYVHVWDQNAAVRYATTTDFLNC
jgi:hypothetical protein